MRLEPVLADHTVIHERKEQRMAQPEEHVTCIGASTRAGLDAIDSEPDGLAGGEIHHAVFVGEKTFSDQRHACAAAVQDADRQDLLEDPGNARGVFHEARRKFV
jgi:hypothetical protein